MHEKIHFKFPLRYEISFFDSKKFASEILTKATFQPIRAGLYCIYVATLMKFMCDSRENLNCSASVTVIDVIATACEPLAKNGKFKFSFFAEHSKSHFVP